jgi:peptide/nickel transport system permease protein
MLNLIRRLRTNKLAFVGFLSVMGAILIAVFSPVIAPYDSTAMNTPNRFAPPGNPGHILGTDEFGRDVLSRILVGSRVSLLVAAVSVGLATLAGGSIGLVAGFVGGQLDNLLMRIVDVIFAIPALMVALGVVGLLGPSAKSVMIALGVAYFPLFARVIRGAVVGIRGQGYIEAARAMGASNWRILGQDVIPNVLPVFMVQATASLAWGILDEASIGFLGLGVQPPTPSWGALLTTGRQYFYQSPTLPVFAGLAVLIVVFGFNLFGDGLRDLLDPRAWQRGE